MIGIVPIALVALDLIDRAARPTSSGEPTLRRAPIGATWILAAPALLFSAGPYLLLPGGASLPLPYVVLYRLVPGFSSVRAPSRFFIVLAAALCALAGYAFARLSTRMQPRVRFTLGVAVALTCTLAAAPRPAATMPAHLGAHAPEAYRWLARQPRNGALLELPGRQIAGGVGGALREALALVGSTIHWQPLIGGYTAYPPRVRRSSSHSRPGCPTPTRSACWSTASTCAGYFFTRRRCPQGCASVGTRSRTRVSFSRRASVATKSTR
jgi:hypothetical protein